MGEFDLFDAPVAVPPAPKAAPARAPTAPADDFSAFDAPVAAPAEPPKDDRGFFARAYDSVTSGAKSVGNVAADQWDLAARAITHPIDTFGTPEGRAAAAEQSIITNPAKRREFERGVDSMVTLGYGQKAAHALEDTAFGRAWNKLTMGEGGGGGLSEEQEAADRTAAPDYRPAGQIAGSFMPGAASGIAKVAGKVAAPIAKAVAPAGAAVVKKLASVPGAGGVLATGADAAGGAVKSALGYEFAAVPAAALSADAEGHRLEAAGAAASDPAGLLISGGIGAVPIIARGITRPALEKLRATAPEVEASARKRAVKDLGKDITAAEGPKATVTDQKRIAEVNDRLFDLTLQKPELRKVFGESAEKALPKVRAIKKEIAGPLDKLYDSVDAKTGGGIKLSDITGDLRARADELATKRLGLEDAKRLRALADQFDEAYLPKTKPLAEGEVPASPVDDVADQLFDLKKLREKAKGVSADALDKEIAELEAKAPAGANDVRIPTRQFREEVTSLHNTAESVMGGLEGTPRHEALEKLYDAGKAIIDKHLDGSGVPTADLAKIRDINNGYFLLSRAEAAIESRGWKEANKPGFKLPHSMNAALHAGAIAPMAAYAAQHPSTIPYMAAATAVTAGGPRIAKAVNWRLANGSYRQAIARLAKAAMTAPSADSFIAQAVRAGLPIEAARRIAEQARIAKAMSSGPTMAQQQDQEGRP
jgi:hypothetical protein